MGKSMQPWVCSQQTANITLASNWPFPRGRSLLHPDRDIRHNQPVACILYSRQIPDMLIDLAFVCVSFLATSTRVTETMLPIPNDKAQDSLFLIEHANGFCCCRLQALGKNRILPLSTQLPYAQVELQLHEEVRVLGVLDLEIRSSLKAEQSDVPKEFAKHWRPSKLTPPETKLSHLLRHARVRMGLSFREASAMSRHIAVELGDKQYFAAPGSLSDYEAVDTPPRHIHKAITLCAAYGLQFKTFLTSIGLDLDRAGKDPIPDNLVPRKLPAGLCDTNDKSDETTGNGFLQQLLNRTQPVPFFLRESLCDLSGLRSPSLHDFFWVGGEPKTPPFFAHVHRAAGGSVFWG